MKLPIYELRSSENFTTFEFTSTGPKGEIPKLIQFSATNYRDVFNLAFGDKNPETGGLDDIVISNNGDSEKILATVVRCVYAFTQNNPEAWIYASGSTKSRTRLYRMGIAKFFEEAKKDFEIYGQINDEWESFRSNVDYEAFLVKLRNA
jgi:hypothetical protein